MKIVIHSHAQRRIAERGATEAEVMETVLSGEKFPAKLGKNVSAEILRLILIGGALITPTSRSRPSPLKKAGLDRDHVVVKFF